MADLTESLRSAKSYNPKTVLGFFATIVGLGLLMVTTTCAILASTGQAIWLIPFVLGFGMLLIIGVAVMVLVVMLRDPAKLMLTQVSGKEYVEIQRRVVLGDSLTGERILSEPVVEAASVALAPLAVESDQEETKADGSRG